MVEEQLILVDERNRATGSAGKTAVHRAGLLHRAFSIFIVDERGRMLLQQRSPKKYHSGGLWANSCCGHPRPGERTTTAANRRLGEELGITSDLSFGFFARYQTPLDDGMNENELVYVYFGKLKSATAPASRRDCRYRLPADRGNQATDAPGPNRIHGLVPPLLRASSRRDRALC